MNEKRNNIIFLCFIMLLAGCGDKQYITNNYTTNHNILELSNICNDLNDNDKIKVSPFSRVTINEGDCILEINYNGFEEDEDEN